MAYRGLGNAKQAQLHLEQPGDVKIQPVDPLMSALDEMLESPRAYDIRGGRSLETGDWADAAAQFRKGLESGSRRIRPCGCGSARHCSRLGDIRGAQEQFERVLQDSPNYARAHYSLGILAEAGGHHDEALKRLSAAVEHGPDDASARVVLAGLLRRDGRLPAGAGAVRSGTDARFETSRRHGGICGDARRLGRYREARDRIVEATTAYPDEPEFAHALARLLAAAPDATVRDGRRALTIVQELLKGRPSTELGETLAMALAEIGQFDQAVRIQRDVIAANEQAGVPDAGQVMAANLESYKSRKPSRTPWPARASGASSR